MKRRMPSLKLLRAFEASARHLSFTSAASELNLSQVAVSKQIKQLELDLQEPLFIRHARSLELTKAAQAYLPKVRDAFERLTDGTQEVFGRRHSKALTVRSAVGFSVNWLTPKLPEFFELYPDVRLRVVSSVWNEVVGNPDFDLDICYGTGKWAGGVGQRLTRDSIMPVCSPSMVADGVLTKPEDLGDQTLIHVLGYEEGWAKWLRAAGVEGIDQKDGLQVDNSLLAFQLAELGMGVALARTSLVERDLASERLVCPFDLSLPIEEAFYLISSQKENEHPDCEVFRSWLLDRVGAH